MRRRGLVRTCAGAKAAEHGGATTGCSTEDDAERKDSTLSRRGVNRQAEVAEDQVLGDRLPRVEQPLDRADRARRTVRPWKLIVLSMRRPPKSEAQHHGQGVAASGTAAASRHRRRPSTQR